MSRATLLALCCAALSSLGCGTRPCKPGTVFVELVFDGASEQATSVELELQLGDDGRVNTQTIEHTQNVSSTTVQIDFPGGYPDKGVVLHVAVRALAGTIVAGSAAQNIEIGSGCTSATIPIGGNDLAGIDLAGLMPPDLAKAGKGAPCDTTSNCVGGLQCVDKVCCADPNGCTDQCAACDVEGHVGDCFPVTGAPHGDRLACLGSDPCTGTCDGTMTNACTYPTTTCGVAASCTAGVGTPVGMCQTGTCMQAPVNCRDNLCGATACQTVLQIRAGFDFGCALISDGSVRCWGANNYGQMGTGMTDALTHTPQAVPGLTGITAIALGSNYACALKLDKTMVCWGRNLYGSNGRPTTDTTTAPQTVCATGSVAGANCVPLADIRKIAAGSFNTCAVAGTNNVVYCWGENDTGQLGNNTVDNPTLLQHPNPVAVCHTTGCPTTLTNNSNGGIKDVAVGADHVCAVDGNGIVYCWGYNNAGQAGTTPNSPTNVPLPVIVANTTVGAQKAVAVGAGLFVSFAIISDGNNANNLVRAWGNGQDGVRGGGTATDGVSNQTPNTVCTDAACAASFTGATSIASVGETSTTTACAATGGGVFCWGDNTRGQLGKGDTVGNSTFAIPSLVTSGATYVGGDGSGTAFCAALSTGGASRCWGSDVKGQLGDGASGAALYKGTPVAQSW
jgi:alpha-tubulin suppressor-like RCC1 family protein